MEISIAKVATYAGHVTAIAAVAAVAWSGAKAISSHYAKQQQVVCLEQRTKLGDDVADLEDTAEAYHWHQMQSVEGTLTEVGKQRLKWLGKEVTDKQAEVDKRGEKVLRVCLGG